MNPAPTFAQAVVNDKPPIYAEIVAAFPQAVKGGVLFSWGDVIYNPSAIEIPASLFAHERVHGERQGSGPDITTWWARYILDRDFRFEEEKLAHIAEYQWWRYHGNRHGRRAAESIIAHRLASPLYGSMIPLHQAKTLLRKST